MGEELLQARWIALLKRIGRDEATKLLSLTQALDAALIQRHESSWDWELLSRNEALPWSLELVERYEDRWDWTTELVYIGISGNKALPWSLKLIERYEDRWEWSGLSGNEALPWSLELIERFEHRWDWDRARDDLRRTKILVLSSSAVDELMTHFAHLEHETTVAGATRA